MIEKEEINARINEKDNIIVFDQSNEDYEIIRRKLIRITNEEVKLLEELKKLSRSIDENIEFKNKNVMNTLDVTISNN